MAQDIHGTGQIAIAGSSSQVMIKTLLLEVDKGEAEAIALAIELNAEQLYNRVLKIAGE